MRHKGVFPHMPSAELGTACHNFQEPAFTQKGKSRTHQRLQSSLLLPWKQFSTHVARETQETATTQVTGQGAAGHKTSQPVLHTHPATGTKGCHTADHVYRGVATFQTLSPLYQPHSHREDISLSSKKGQNQLSPQSHSPGAGVTVFRR